MNSYTLQRTGQAPLTFSGEMIVESDTATAKLARWHELAIYQTTGGSYVVSIVYRTKWLGELDHHTAVVATSLRASAKALVAHDPTACVHGYPAGDAYAHRQARLLSGVLAQYQATTSIMLGAYPEFAEVVP